MTPGLPEGDRFTALMRFQQVMRRYAAQHHDHAGPLTPEQTIPLVEAACQQLGASPRVLGAAKGVLDFLGSLVANKGRGRDGKQPPVRVSSQALGDFAAWLDEQLAPKPQ
jgi:hypothetical protein